MRNERDMRTLPGALQRSPSDLDGSRIVPLESVEKGSLRTMWELLMQLRVLLPYLTRLAPLLDRGLVKAAPDQSEFRHELRDVQSGNRELSARLTNQALQLERIEGELLQLRQISERALIEARTAGTEIRSLTRWIRTLTTCSVVALLLLVAIALLRTGR